MKISSLQAVEDPITSMFLFEMIQRPCRKARFLINFDPIL